jgi:DNA-directed RNA polymerase III subunit RPC2
MDDREKAMEALCNVVLSHIPVKDFDLYEKSIYLTIMIRRVLYTFKNPGSVDDRDYYGNKRLEMLV